MVEWKPITEEALVARIAQGYARMTPTQQGLWRAVRIDPEKWQQSPFGDAGGGFWTVGLLGRSVIWYNDIDDGFNRSRYTTYGRIDDYWRNDDELEITVQYVANALSLGYDLLNLGSQQKKRR